MSQVFLANELDYELPETSIAQSPLGQRDAAKLLRVPRTSSSNTPDLNAPTALEHHIVRELPALLAPSLLVLNDTRVIPARLFGQKTSGGRVEILLVERMASAGPRERWRAMGRASKGLRPGEKIAIADGTLSVHVLSAAPGLLEIDLCVVDEAHPTASAGVELLGAMPLPPYIRRDAAEADTARYQTVFAANPGAVAAPTAGLHFTPELLSALQAAGHELAYVTLHVGPGTFAPLRSNDLSQHTMHEERYEIPEATSAAIALAREQGRQVVAVGTTVVRTLESAATVTGHVPAGPSATSIFIYPPYGFRVVDALLTNFHLPRSTLLALVMAFGGVATIRDAYRSAIDSGYRFYSYGDCMLIGGAR